MPATRQPHQPWYSSLTLDVFVKLLNNTVFHPFICCLVPLCLRAGEVPYDEPVMINTIAWAIVMVVVALLQPMGDRLAFGEPRELDHEEEVIVITGGCSGLGRTLAETYALKGASVAVLDRKGVDRDAVVENVRYYACDIGDRDAVTRCWKAINKELGLPTILIHSAGIVHGKTALDLTTAQVTDTFTSNVLAHYHLNQLFLPPLKDHPTGGTLVTVASVLGRLGAAQLSDYTASKAALIAMHQSLAAELAAFPRIKTILCTPGQLSTEMFRDLRQGPIAHFFGPIVEVSEFAVQLLKMIGDGRGGVLAEPFYARWIGLLELCPPGVQKKFRQMTKLDTAMADFRPPAEGGEDASEESVELL